MASNVHQISDARKAKAERGHVMHLYNGRDGSFNPACSYCRTCDICGETACNNPSYLKRAKEDGEEIHEWTSDIGIWAKHSNPCKVVPILRGPDIPATSGDASGDTSPGQGGVHLRPHPDGGFYPFTEENCTGHVASPGNSKICGLCGVHVDELRPDEGEDF